MVSVTKIADSYAQQYIESLKDSNNLTSTKTAFDRYVEELKEKINNGNINSSATTNESQKTSFNALQNKLAEDLKLAQNGTNPLDLDEDGIISNSEMVEYFKDLNELYTKDMLNSFVEVAKNSSFGANTFLSNSSNSILDSNYNYSTSEYGLSLAFNNLLYNKGINTYKSSMINQSLIYNSMLSIQI